MNNKTRATWVNWILGLLLATIAFGAGASHFSNLYNAPASTSPYFQTCPTSSDPTGCEEAELPLYEATHQQEDHWMTTLMVLAGISGLLCFCTIVVFLSESSESKKAKKRELAQHVSNPIDEVKFAKAVELVKQQRKASTSLLQRQLHIGYGEASRLVMEMEARGIVGAADGTRPREVY